MRLVTFHFALMFIWVALSDEPTWHSYVIGLLVAELLWHGNFIIVRNAPVTMRKAAATARLACRFVYELVKSNLDVTLAIMRDPRSMTPCIISFPVDGMSDGAITLLANMITATPGTTSLDVTPDRKILYVHALLGANPDAVRAGIDEAFARTIREIWR